MRNPLLLPAAALAAGILVSRWSPFTVRDAAWPVCAFFALAALARPQWLRRACALLGMICAGTLTEAWHRPGPPPEIDAGWKETVLLDGCVVEPTVLSPGREQFTLELEPYVRARVSQAVDDDAPTPRLPYGQRVEIEARVRAPHNYSNPGSFEYAGYLARQRIYWTAAMTRGSAPRILPGRCGSRRMAFVFRLRTSALERLERLYAGDSYATGMMQAILIGETSGLQRAWTEGFRRTGTFHALVISGVHVTVLAGVLLFLLRLCALPELGALAATAAAAWLYALVSGLSAPVVRAAGGFSLCIAARFLFRRRRVMNLLAAITIAYLLWDPYQLFDASFQLSFLSVAAIGALATPLLEPRIAPLARGMRSIRDVGIDPHLEPRVTQARVELRLAAETIDLDPPAAKLGGNRPCALGAARVVRGGNGGDLHSDSDRPSSADGRIFSPHFAHGPHRESADLPRDGNGCALGIRRHLHPIGDGWRRRRTRYSNSPPAWPIGTRAWSLPGACPIRRCGSQSDSQ
jgi:competence protein ComEC